MKIKTILITFLVFISSVVSFGQGLPCVPVWGENVDDGNGDNASFTAVIYLDGEKILPGQGFVVSAFRMKGDEEVQSSKNFVMLDFSILGPEYSSLVFFQIYADKHGDIITFKLYDCKTGCTFVSEDTYSYVNDDAVEQPIHFYSVAEEGGNKYPTLQDAYAQAADGDVITLTANASGPGLVIDRNITIDFAGKEYALNGTESNTFQIEKGRNVTLKNGTLSAANTSDILIQNYSELTLDNMTLKGMLEINDGAQVYHNTKGVNAIVRKDFAGTDAGTQNWETISTPIAGAAIPTGTHDLYRYDEESQQWLYYQDNGNGNASAPFPTLDLGHGYLYAAKDNITVALEGELNVSAVTRALTTTANEHAGFHMIGNPFVHNITDAHFTGVTLADGFYTTASTGAWIANKAGTTIPPMESVLVQAMEAGDLTIVKSFASKRAEGENNGSIAINVSNGEFMDVAYVSFNEGIGLDKIAHRNSDVPMLSVPVEGKQYAIAVMDKDVTEIPVSFKAAVMGEYTIGAEAQDCQYSVMTLVDRQTGIETNLLLEDYTFIATSNDNTERFIIRLAKTESEASVDNTFAYISNSTINIDNIEGSAVVRVYDVMGRYVSEHNVYESARISVAEYAKGVYVIHMIDESGVRVQKLLVD